MGGTIDTSLILTLGGMLFSIAAAAAVAKREIKLLADQAQDFENRLRKLDQRLDRLENTVDTTQHRLGILASMSSPDTMERRTREVERLRADVDQLVKRDKQ